VLDAARVVYWKCYLLTELIVSQVQLQAKAGCMVAKCHKCMVAKYLCLLIVLETGIIRHFFFCLLIVLEIDPSFE
jgi:hypothetical protein